MDEKNSDDWMELLCIKYKATLKGKIKIISKDELRSMGIKSPNSYDALSLTFVNLIGEYDDKRENPKDENFDKHDIM